MEPTIASSTASASPSASASQERSRSREATSAVYGTAIAATISAAVSWVCRAGSEGRSAQSSTVPGTGTSATGTAMDPGVVILPEHTGSGGPFSHEGEELIYVLSGVLFVELKGDEHSPYRLEPRDSFHFPSTIFGR